jgi:hypothetical protein
MLWNQLKILAAVLLTVGLLATGAGWFAYRILAADQKPVKGHTVVKTNAKEAKQDNKNKQPKQVPLQLEKALAKAAEEAYHANWNDVVVGRIIPDEATCQWSRRWLKAQLPLSKKKAGQVAAYTAHRDRMKKLEKIAKEEFDGGKIAAKHYGTVKYFLVEAEIWLARAKSGE